MIVPEYWSEAKQRISHNGRNMTIKRFGWSDRSEADARRNAEERVADAVDRIRAGGNIRLVDHKVAYNGAEGLPIREEIIARHGDSVITRNSYGALCLNTPDVLFADVDIDAFPGPGLLAVVFWLIVIATGVWALTTFDQWFYAIIGIAVVAWVANFILGKIADATTPIDDRRFNKALERIKAFADEHRDWHLRVYRTPAGYRVLVMHDIFDPREEPAFDFMKAIGGDPLYATMCRNQKCFRARVSPKPWRLGLDRLGPRPGVWPIREERMSARREWVRKYEASSGHFASCRYEASFGDTRTHRKCDEVMRVHDEYCQATSSLAIA